MTDTPPPDTPPAEVAATAAVARDAAPWLAATSLEDRAGLLRAMADALDGDVDRLVALADEETALGDQRLRGEVGRTTGQLRMFADAVELGEVFEPIIDTADPSATPPRPDLRRALVPLGPVAVFAASNFPFAFSVAGGDTASALAAGCPVVVKASPGHPRLSAATTEVLVAALADVGAPEGVLSVVHGLDAGTALVEDPSVRAVGFTGSTSGGRALFDLATGREDPVPFYGELGSSNPVVVTPGAATQRADEVAEGLVGSFTLGVGQFCTKPGVVFVPAGSDLPRRVAEHVDADPQPMLGERIADAFRSAAADLDGDERLEAAVDAPSTSGGDGAAHLFVTDVATLLEDPATVFEERFGPLTVLVTYEDLDQVQQALALAPGSLTLSLFAADDEWAGLGDLVARAGELAGRVVFDAWPTGVAVTAAMHHGGPWPATTAPLHTSVGTTAIRRWLRPVAWQGAPPALLPPLLRDDNPLGTTRRVDGRLTADPVG